MAMDVDDQRYFTQQFQLVHKRISDSEKAQTSELHKVTDEQNNKIAEISKAIGEHKVESSQHSGAAVRAASEAAAAAVKDHNDESWVHNPVKTWGLIGSIVGALAAVGGFVWWFIKHFQVSK